MIERGLPADEIERILYASSENRPPKSPTRSTSSKPQLSTKDVG
jgi:hypothetical protein